MINREKFDALTDKEKHTLGMSIGYPHYEDIDNDKLFTELNRLWSIACDEYTLAKKGDSSTFIDIVGKLK